MTAQEAAESSNEVKVGMAAPMTPKEQLTAARALLDRHGVRVHSSTRARWLREWLAGDNFAQIELRDSIRIRRHFGVGLVDDAIRYEVLRRGLL